MSPLIFRALHLLDAEVAESLEYWHEPIPKQLDLGLRKLEIDIFFDPRPGVPGRPCPSHRHEHPLQNAASLFDADH